jgi:hypothetical protein
MRILRHCIASAALALTACATSTEHVPFERILAGKDFPQAASEAECVSRRGTWQDVSEAVAAGPGTAYACIIPTTDGGQACASSSECQGLCELATERPVRIGDRAEGRCMATYFYGGCRAYVHRGRLGSRMCSE